MLGFAFSQKLLITHATYPFQRSAPNLELFDSRLYAWKNVGSCGLLKSTHSRIAIFQTLSGEYVCRKFVQRYIPKFISIVLQTPGGKRLGLEMYDLLQCVDRGLDSFGTNMKQAVYWTMMSNAAISCDKIVSNPDAFIKALREVFRDAYPLAERSIIREMKKTFDLRGVPSSYNIVDAFELASKEITEITET